MRCSSDPPSSRLRLLDGGIVAILSCALIDLCSCLCVVGDDAHVVGSLFLFGLWLLAVAKKGAKLQGNTLIMPPCFAFVNKISQIMWARPSALYTGLSRHTRPAQHLNSEFSLDLKIQDQRKQNMVLVMVS